MTNPVYVPFRYQPTDINGVPLEGAVLHFFQAGTTTPVTVYADVGLTTPLGSTITADGSGTFAPAYMTSQVIKTQLYDTNGVLQPNGTIDNIALGTGDGTFILKQSTNPAPTVEGDIQWDTDDNRIAVGNGGSTSTFSNDATNAATYLNNSSIATAAQYLNNTPNKVIGPTAAWGALAPGVITSSASITPDLSTAIDFTLTITSNFALNNFSNVKQGQRGRVAITQDGTGNRAITTWGSSFVSVNGQKPILSTAAGATDTLYYDCETTTRIVVSLGRNIS